MINKKVILRLTKVPEMSLPECWSIGVLEY